MEQQATTASTSGSSGVREGIADAESLNEVVCVSIRPKSLLVLRGTPEQTAALAADCAQRIEGLHTYLPANGEPINVTSDQNIYRVRLTEVGERVRREHRLDEQRPILAQLHRLTQPHAQRSG